MRVPPFFHKLWAPLAAVMCGLGLFLVGPPGTDVPVSGRLGRALVALGEAINAQEAKVVAALLFEGDNTFESNLRAARNMSIGSVPAALKEVEDALREAQDVPGAKPSRRLFQELLRLTPLEARIDTAIERYLEALGEAGSSSEELRQQREALISTVRETQEVAYHLLGLYEEEWPKLSERQRADAAELLGRLRPLLFLGLLGALVGGLVQGRAERLARAELTRREANEAQARTLTESLEAERDQLRQAERRASLELALLRLEQQSLTESLRSSVLVCDTTLLLRLANSRARSLFTLDDSTLGRSLLDLRSLEPILSGIGGNPALTQLLTEAKRLEIAELKLESAGAWLYVSVTPYVDEAGHVRGLILLADDITQAIETRRRLMQTERLAAMGRLSAQVTHEIRNPLSAISLNTDLLHDEIETIEAGGDPGEAKQLLMAISREVERLTEVTDEYLRLSRLRPPSMHHEDLDALVTELVDFLAEDLRRRHIVPRILLDSAGARVLADAAQLRQAFMNIFKNSMESMPNGGELEISTRRDDGRVCLEVRDHGEGIPEHVLARIFDPFYTTKEGGTGLGLPITQQIVSEHGGEVSAESSRGQGTRILVQLPLI